jgi:hypothetical protein
MFCVKSCAKAAVTLAAAFMVILCGVMAPVDIVRRSGPPTDYQSIAHDIVAPLPLRLGQPSSTAAKWMDRDTKVR